MTTPAPNAPTLVTVPSAPAALVAPPLTPGLHVNTPQPGMATIVVGDTAWVLRRVKTGEFKALSFASVDIEDQLSAAIAAAGNTRAQIEALVMANELVYGWLCEALCVLGPPDAVLPPYEELDADLCTVPSMGALIAMWMGSPPVPGAP